MHYRLQLFNVATEATEREWILKLPAVVGRSPDANVSIGDASISRNHCEFYLNGAGALSVRDLKSMNGTFVDGRQVERTTVPPDGLIKIGAITLKIEWTEDPLTERKSFGKASVDSTQPMKVITQDDLRRRS